MNRVVRKPTFCICKNKDADQLRSNREADQRLCFRYTDSTIPLLSKSEILSLQPSSIAAQPGLCQTWSETPKTGFLTTRLICKVQTWGHIYTETFRDEIHSHRVQRRMISVDNFFVFFEIIIFCFVVAICDLVHDVETIVHLQGLRLEIFFFRH